MPAHNEEEYLITAVLDVLAGLRAGGRAFEILVVENGSSDGTLALARSLETEHDEVRVLSLPDPDYGAALRRGFLEAHGDLVAIFDVDFYDLAFLSEAADLIEARDGPDIVVGSKRAEGAVDGRMWTRRAITAAFGAVLRVGFGLNVSDTHGIKVARRAPLESIAAGCHAGTDLFDTELVLRAERAGLRVDEIPVRVEQRRPSRSSIGRRIPRTVVGLARLRVALWRAPA